MCGTIHTARLASAGGCARHAPGRPVLRCEFRRSRIRKLLVSETVTDAIQVMQADMDSAPVRLWLLADRARLLVLVWDASPLPPVRVSSSPDAENGRGLLLVETISARWGWQFLPDKGGKVVWALTILE